MGWAQNRTKQGTPTSAERAREREGRKRRRRKGRERQTQTNPHAHTHTLSPSHFLTHTHTQTPSLTGGFADRPGNMVDPFHTLFGIAALSMLGEGGIEEVDCVYCMP